MTVLHTRDRDEANSPEFYKAIETASGIWFSGGRQWRHADSYLGTNTQKVAGNFIFLKKAIATI